MDTMKTGSGCLQWGINYINGENWISDGKYYSSSTTIAALDMTLGLIGDMLDIDIAEKLQKKSDIHGTAIFTYEILVIIYSR